jgi:hypothetical protein
VIDRFERVVLPRVTSWLAAEPCAEVRLLRSTTTAFPEAWDVMMLLRFGSLRQLDAWCELERTRPAGLMPEELAGIAEIHTAWADVLAEVRAPVDERTLVLVRPYTLTDPDVYPAYAAAYLVPEFEGWRRAGALSGYAVLVNRFPSGKAWDIMLLQQYRDAPALARREDVRGSTIDSLRADPGWHLLHESKEEYRITNRPENIAVIARPVVGSGGP